ncbi:hypothetical protein E2C01_009456 [Portunus trituberculatus]|uniref:Uncharacterized protein n=1 Tax=Portunus trituberculatus TaxID=210409 RepID=A0A5B7D5U7_PORTR|nr:hypothetical protein [Portunus trituberculatus]
MGAEQTNGFREVGPSERRSCVLSGSLWRRHRCEAAPRHSRSLGDPPSHPRPRADVAWRGRDVVAASGSCCRERVLVLDPACHGARRRQGQAGLAQASPGGAPCQ